MALEVDARNSGRWRRCATIAHVDMPRDWATKCTIGMLARTGEVVSEIIVASIAAPFLLGLKKKTCFTLLLFFQHIFFLVFACFFFLLFFTSV